MLDHTIKAVIHFGICAIACSKDLGIIAGVHCAVDQCACPIEQSVRAIFIQTTGEDAFSVLSSTIVLADKKEDFEGRLNSLMAMSDEDIDAAYEEQLLNQITGSEKGAGLGLFEIRRQVKTLSFEFEPDGEDFMLVMRADI